MVILTVSQAGVEWQLAMTDKKYIWYHTLFAENIWWLLESCIIIMWVLTLVLWIFFAIFFIWHLGKRLNKAFMVQSQANTKAPSLLCTFVINLLFALKWPFYGSLLGFLLRIGADVFLVLIACYNHLSGGDKCLRFRLLKIVRLLGFFLACFQFAHHHLFWICASILLSLWNHVLLIIH